jgi:hypothetical protein
LPGETKEKAITSLSGLTLDVMADGMIDVTKPMEIAGRDCTPINYQASTQSPSGL